MPHPTYLITGIDCRGKRFRKNCGTNQTYALAHNVWRGTLWAVRNGKRKKIHTWWN